MMVLCVVSAYDEMFTVAECSSGTFRVHIVEIVMLAAPDRKTQHVSSRAHCVIFLVNPLYLAQYLARDRLF